MDTKLHKLVDLIDGVSQKLTDAEYKALVESVAELRQHNVLDDDDDDDINISPYQYDVRRAEFQAQMAESDARMLEFEIRSIEIQASIDAHRIKREEIALCEAEQAEREALLKIHPRAPIPKMRCGGITKKGNQCLKWKHSNHHLWQR